MHRQWPPLPSSLPSHWLQISLCHSHHYFLLWIHLSRKLSMKHWYHWSDKCENHDAIKSRRLMGELVCEDVVHALINVYINMKARRGTDSCAGMDVRHLRFRGYKLCHQQCQVWDAEKWDFWVFDLQRIRFIPVGARGPENAEDKLNKRENNF